MPVRSGIAYRKNCVGCDFMVARQTPFVDVAVAEVGWGGDRYRRRIAKLIGELIAELGWRVGLAASAWSVKSARVESEEEFRDRGAEPSLRSIVEFTKRIEDANPPRREVVWRFVRS